MKDPCEECIVKVCCGCGRPCSEYLQFIAEQRANLYYLEFKKEMRRKETNE